MSKISCVSSKYFENTETLKQIADSVYTPYFFLYTKSPSPRLGAYAEERFVQIARATGAVMLYSDYYAEREGHP